MHVKYAFEQLQEFKNNSYFWVMENYWCSFDPETNYLHMVTVPKHQGKCLSKDDLKFILQEKWNNTGGIQKIKYINMEKYNTGL